MKNIAGSASRWVDVAPARFPGWIVSFAGRHGGAAADPAGGPGLATGLTVALAGENVIFTAPDGAVAEIHPPFPPVPGLPGHAAPGAPDAPDAPTTCAAAIAAHAMRSRTVGVLLVRLGGYAAGVFTGSPPELAASKTGARLVHGRSAAGGWSQHRFARRREKQAAEALEAAADAAVAVLGQAALGHGASGQAPPGQALSGHRVSGQAAVGQAGDRHRTGQADNSKRRGVPALAVVSGLDAVVLGGDKRAVAELREDPRLAPYFALAVDRFLTVPDPKLTVLKDTPRLFLAVRIRLMEPTL